ncbi:predicted protein [Sclerotinia sclerotiorum 1980 UF-70]|uniref:Uncharacterized protein n=1 Tax=Sclerotinia sclerotiorum (strain ATCC 18683 / 1980 / Ss-1) TaxID=665079 RepID=A7E454_SCLS1|nr:predicted protein [Sclerotinia sclerotiorum 1980 UF-70]EDN90676.1 predicted protein [Sclerotinia sclerotiorum 1980 UF-70]
MQIKKHYTLSFVRTQELATVPCTLMFGGAWVGWGTCNLKILNENHGRIPLVAEGLMLLGCPFFSIFDKLDPWALVQSIRDLVADRIDLTKEGK